MNIVLCQLGHGAGLPDSPPEDYESQEEFLKAAHHVLMEVRVRISLRLSYISHL